MSESQHRELLDDLPRQLTLARILFQYDGRHPLTIFLNLLDKDGKNQLSVLQYPRIVDVLAEMNDEKVLAELYNDANAMRSSICLGQLPEYAVLAEVSHLGVQPPDFPEPSSNALRSLLCYVARPEKEGFLVADALTNWRELEDAAAAAALPPMFVGLYAREAYLGN